jgi:rare lipoprotein A (peptidoglycan hydrolase)
MTINKLAWVASGVSFLAIAGGNWLGTTWLETTALMIPRSPLPIARHEAVTLDDRLPDAEMSVANHLATDAVAIPVVDSWVASPRITPNISPNVALTPVSPHRFAPLDETNAFWRCPADLRQQLPTAVKDRFPVKMQGCVVAYVADAAEAQRLSRQLDRQLQDPQTNWAAVTPKMVGDSVVIRQGQQILLRLDPTIAAQFDSHPHRLVADWANNMRRVAGQSPLSFAQAQKQMYAVLDTADTTQGTASWYGPYFHGRMTANGEIYNQNDLTAAHRTLPLGTYVQVTNRHNGRSVVVRINDRGPYYDEDNRIIDLSYRAAQMLDGEDKGVMPIDLVVLQAGQQLSPVIQTIAFSGDYRSLPDRRIIR